MNVSIPFVRPAISEAEIEAVADVLRSGWITTGPRAGEFEQAFAEHLGASRCVTVCSATGGMHLALLALGVGPGDEVITPSMTWVSTVNLIELLGATPVFVDVDRDTLMTSADYIAPAITARTKAVVPVHFGGVALDLDPIYTLAEHHGVTVIEDAAHAVGTSYGGRPVGQRGVAVFSFQAIKNLTCAEGGAICTDDEALAERIRRLRFHGLGMDAFDRATQGRSAQAEVLEPGFKYNLPDINAALALVQLRRIRENNARRRALAERYLAALAGLELEPLAQPPDPNQRAWHLFVVRVDAERCGLDRDAFMQALKQHGVASGLHFRAVHRQKYYRERYPQVSLPATEWNSERICSLPLFPDLSAQQQGHVIGAIKSILAKGS